MSSYSAEERREMLVEDAIPALNKAIDALDAAGLDDAVFDAGCALNRAKEVVRHLGGDEGSADGDV